ncbi:CaiB/BaiF CoA transferase family protein [Nocardioides campestrisoli]|uniref:CaiB/BaiF CoA transferase family protein n=1 Tax=Nocardioides campestrisoli TaxID=2736757 RepID=UPI00163DB5EA|nr:CaiB/BaiF CoA-transferase family protein [Nocardioides campestrisoli]
MHTPLDGLKVLELAGIGPGPHAAMVLADLGADVHRLVRPGVDPGPNEHTTRGRRGEEADLKEPTGVLRVLELVREADVLIEGFRPGVAERLGVGPEECLAQNPRLVYVRMTGWGQDGPRAPTAGHDINYLSVTGVLDAIGPSDTPVPPLNVVADNGGGSMFALTGLLAALWRRERTGQGCVVDVAIVDGVAVLAQQVLELVAQGAWGPGTRGSNLLDGGAPYYRTYRCSDGRSMAVGPIEPQFYALLLAGLGLEPSALPDREDRTAWPALVEVLASRFAEHDRDHWTAVFAGTDACVTPVLTFAEAGLDHHMRHRGALLRTRDGHLTAGPAPRFTDAPS